MTLRITWSPSLSHRRIDAGAFPQGPRLPARRRRAYPQSRWRPGHEHRAGVDAIVGRLETAGVPEHVGMHREAELGAHAQPLDHLLEPIRRDRGLALRHEEVR